MQANITIDELRALFAKADDGAGHHILWVDKDLVVHLNIVPEELSPIGFEHSQPSMLARFGTFVRGNGFVGESAAADDSWMLKLNEKLSDLPVSERVSCIENY